MTASGLSGVQRIRINFVNDLLRVPSSSEYCLENTR